MKRNVLQSNGRCNFYANERKSLIKNILQSNVESLEELYVYSGCTPSTFYNFCIQHKIFVPYFSLKPFRYDETLDYLCDNGELDRVEIAKLANKSAEFVRQYLITSGQYKEWKQKRYDYLRRKQDEKKLPYMNMAHILKQVLNQKLETAKWHEKMAILYSNRKRNNSRRKLSVLSEFLRRYKQAKDKGKNTPLIKLSKGLYDFPSQPSSILKTLGLEPLNKIKQRVPFTQAQINTIRDSYNLGNSISCTAEIVGASYQAVIYYFNKYRLEEQNANKNAH